MSKKQKILSTVLASSFLIGTVGCDVETVGLLTDVAKSFLKDLKDGNKATLDLATVDEEGNEQALASDEVERVEVDGQPVDFTFDDEGNIVLADLDFSSDVEVEAEVFLKGFDRPVLLVISPDGQKRDAIKKKAKISIDKKKKFVLNDRVETFKEGADEEVEFAKKAVPFKLGKIAEELKGKRVVGLFFDGQRVPQTDARVSKDGVLWVNVSAARRFLFSVTASQLAKKARKAKAKSVDITQSASFKKKKAALKKKVLKSKKRFVRRRVVTKTRVVKTTRIVRKSSSRTFRTAQTRGANISINIDLNATIRKLSPAQRAKLDARKKQIKQQQKAKLEAAKNRAKASAKKRKKKLVAGKAQFKGKELTAKKVANLSGAAKAKLAKEGSFVDRTLYIIAIGDDGKPCVFKFKLTAERIQDLYIKLEKRAKFAKAKANAARKRFEEASQSGDVEDLDEFVEEIAEETDEEELIISEGGADDLEVELEPEEIDEDSDTDGEQVDSVEEAEEIIEAEEIEEAVEEEVAEEIAADLEEETGEEVDPDEIELDIDEDDVEEIEAEEGLADEVEEEIVDEDLIDEQIDEEFEEAVEAEEEAEAEEEDAEAEELALEELLEEDEEFSEEDLVETSDEDAGEEFTEE